jgi:hypothetical protein
MERIWTATVGEDLYLRTESDSSQMVKMEVGPLRAVTVWIPKEDQRMPVDVGFKWIPLDHTDSTWFDVGLNGEVRLMSKNAPIPIQFAAVAKKEEEEEKINKKKKSQPKKKKKMEEDLEVGKKREREEEVEFISPPVKVEDEEDVKIMMDVDSATLIKREEAEGLVDGILLKKIPLVRQEAIPHPLLGQRFGSEKEEEEEDMVSSEIKPIKVIEDEDYFKPPA